MASGIPIGDILRFGYNTAKTSLGHRFIGQLAQPIFVNLRERELKKLEEDDLEEAQEQPITNPIEKAAELFKSNFTWGDLTSLAGIALMSVQKYFSPAKEGKDPGFFEKIFKAIGLGMTFGGSTASIIGRMSQLDLQTALGKDFALAQLNHATKQGIQIFKEFTNADKAQLKKEAEELDRILVYKDGVRESILERFARDEIGGLLDGPPGTGKTAGVLCMLGKWAKRVEEEGDEAVIAQLNLANFNDYLKEIKQKRQELSELANAHGAQGLGGIFASNEGLQILEMLIRKIQNEKTKVDKHNMQSGAKKQKLVIFVDEFDKVFDPATLHGCDKTRLKNLLIQLNELFMKTEILLTSNRTLEQMTEVLQTELNQGEDQDGSEVWKPMYDRFVSKNRVFIDMPSAQERAEIIAGYLIDQYSYAIDWKDFGLQGATGNFELDRKLLGKAIETNLEGKINRKLNGRQIKYICDDIGAMLLGLARLLKMVTNTISNSEWDKLSAQDRITKTGAKINRQVLLKAITHKIENMKLDITEDHAYKPVKPNSGLVELFAKAADALGKGLANSDLKIDPSLINAVAQGVAHSLASAN